MKANTERSYRGLLWTLAVIGTVLDQVGKYGVFKWLYDPACPPGETREHALGSFSWRYDGHYLQGECNLLPGVFKLLAQFTGQHEAGHGWLAALRTWSSPMLPKVNHGALFGLGGEYAMLANAVFAVVSIVAALAIMYWSTRRSTARDLALCAALGLILAGTVGNLYDRLIFGGVRDFLYFYWIDWPVFNIADCCLVCGAFLLLAQAFWSRSPVERNVPATTKALAAAAGSRGE
ncbi:MAG: signal peptidase II [Planctomycetes bacterium]|nr:signal peptidase II [Planctomycetota bacterium]